MTLKSRGKWFVGSFAALLLLSLSSAAMAGQVTGAIFTTLKDGSAVNFNVYAAKTDVYLNGGPNSPNAPCSAAGLPDGYYYFQVTDPSGKILLSTDDDLSKRKVRVQGGIITAYLGGTHGVGGGKCGSVTVQLMPFNDTPNPGGEYKVWMQSVTGFTGFLPSKSKTDNFKAPVGADSDGDGLSDAFEINVSHTDMMNPDTDGDGLTDGEEVNDYHTDPLDWDTDRDGLSDYDEVKILGTDPNKFDTDGDGVDDGTEIQNGTNPLPDTGGEPPPPA